ASSARRRSWGSPLEANEEQVLARPEHEAAFRPASLAGERLAGLQKTADGDPQAALPRKERLQVPRDHVGQLRDRVLDPLDLDVVVRLAVHVGRGPSAQG